MKKAFKITKRLDLQKAERIKLNLLRLENQEKSSENTKIMQDLRGELRQENIARMNQGQKPIYVNNGRFLSINFFFLKCFFETS